MSDIKFTYRGPGKRKLISIVMVSFMVTAGLVVIVPMTMPTASAYMTPDAGLIWNFDDLVMNSGGAVTGAFPFYQINDPILTIAPTDTIMLMGGEDVWCAPGTFIEVMGMFDGMAGAGAIFHGTGITGEWQGFWVQPMGNFMIFDVDIVDAVDGVFADNCIMTNIDNCYFGNCLNSGITYNGVMGGPMIGGNTIEECDTGIISIDSSSQIIGNTIRFCPTDGLMLNGWAGPMIDDNDIYGNGNYGVNCFNLDGASFTNNDIYGNINDAVYMINSHADFNGNRIYGWNATPGSGMAGSHAVHITGTANFGIWMFGNTIIGGSGDEWMGLGVPNGGHAIWADNFEGGAAGWPQLNIDNNPHIQGGEGGENHGIEGFAGDGGDAIRVDGIPDLGDPSTDNEALRITGNRFILGGHGGDNNPAATNGSAGDGGYGIRIIDDDFAGSQEISGNTFILAGDGGDNHADDTEFPSNWHCGNGGDGIYIQDAWMTVPTEVLDNPHVEGGKGGNGTANGQFKKAGKGGDGINFKAVTNATIDPTLAYGGDGGNNTGTLILGGDGGDGILIETFSDRFSIVNIIDANGTGGEGGDNYMAGGPGGGGAGWGGDGLEVNDGSMAFSMNSNYTGGKGGDTYADMDFGGMGGRGVYVWNASSINAILGNIIGGAGGDSRFAGPFSFGSQGGLGGFGVSLEPAGTSGFFDGVTLISGGEGGDVLFDPFGGPGFGYGGFFAIQSDSVTVMNSEIVPGNGGYDWVDLVYGGNGEYGVEILNVANPINIDGNTVHEARWVGIRVNQCNGNIDNNEVFNGSATGIELTGLSPALNSNNIHDNDMVGIMTRLNSDPTISRCTIDDSGTYAFYIETNSDPDIINCTISNSGIADWFVDQNSHPTSLNTTNDKTVVINDALSDLTMNWFMHTQVVDQFFIPVAGAEVWINDTFGTNILNDFTPANGWINWTVVTEFIETQAARTYYTDHNATAIAGLQQGWATPEPTMDASREVIIVLGASVYNIFLNQGWNLISVPLIQADESIDEVLRTIDGQWDYIRIYDPLDPEPWKSNCTYKPESLNDFDTLNHMQGFWIDITSASATLTVTGTEPITTDIPLYAGWNLVGYPSFTEMSINGALAGTGYDRPVEGFDISELYDIKQLPDTYFMKPGEAYWIHVPVDTIWTVENFAGPSAPYPIFGFVYLYDGMGMSYNPMPSMGGAMVEITWWDVYNGWRTEFTPTIPTGQYSYDLTNYSDGGVVYINATFDAPFNNRGYNYTYIDIMMGMSMQDVVCGVPYDILIVNPPPFMPIPLGMPTPVDFVVFDRNGLIAQGYYTFIDGPIDWWSTDPVWFPPPPVVFDGTASPTPGQWNDIVVFNTPGIQTIEIYEGGMPGNDYLTPWGAFYIDPDNTLPGWMKDWDIVMVDVI